jgi:predicted ATPase
MIDHLRIDAFKSIAEADLDLGVFNIFVGPNGSGKSNLLEAIGVLSAAANGRVDDEALLRRGVRPGVPALYKSSFSGATMKSAINLEVQSGIFRYRVGLHNPASDPKPAWSYKTESLLEGEKKLIGRSPRSTPRLNPYQGLLALQSVVFPEDSDSYSFVRNLQDYSIYTPNTPTLRGLVSDPQPRDPVGLNGGRLAESYREVLRSHNKREATKARRSLIEWVTTIGTGTPEYLISSSVSAPRVALKFRDKYMAEKRNELTAYDASEGALFVLFAIVLCFHPAAPTILAIDNFDQALNPLLARRLTNLMSLWLLETSQRQMFLTAHNPLVLDGLPLADDRVRLFTVARSTKGRTVVRRILITTKMRQMVESEGWTLSRMWTTGRLGGVPNL